MFNVLRRDIVADLLHGRITVEDFYRRMYFLAVAITGTILAVSLVADVAGMNGLNIVLIPLWVIVVGYFGFHPTYVLAAATIGAAASLGRDADRQRVIDGMGAALAKWKKFLLHGAMFGGVFFLTRFLVPIKIYPFAGMILLGALVTLGLWNWLYESGTVYKKYVLSLVLVSLAIGLYGAFSGKPASIGSMAAGSSGSLREMVTDIRYGKTVEIEVETLQPQQLCGIRPGERTFSIPQKVFVLIKKSDKEMMSNYEVSDYVRVNGTLPKESFVIGNDGCANITFAFSKDFRKKSILPQVIPIRFE